MPVTIKPVLRLDGKNFRSNLIFTQELTLIYELIEGTHESLRYFFIFSSFEKDWNLSREISAKQYEEKRAILFFTIYQRLYSAITYH